VERPRDRSRDWLRQAERDLEAGRNSSAAGYHEWAVFAAQQCAEKAAKAFIAKMRGAERGHSILGLL
jgi:HEPN domain-containing protein